MSSVSAKGVAAQAAARFNLTLARDGAWRGHCPCCNYAKPTLTISVRDGGIAISCVACGESAGIAVIAGIPPDLLGPAEPKASKFAKALNLWTKGALESGTPVERYIKGRGVTIPVPPSIRYLARQRNWTDGRSTRR